MRGRILRFHDNLLPVERRSSVHVRQWSLIDPRTVLRPNAKATSGRELEQTFERCLGWQVVGHSRRSGVALRKQLQVDLDLTHVQWTP